MFKHILIKSNHVPLGSTIEPSVTTSNYTHMIKTKFTQINATQHVLYDLHSTYFIKIISSKHVGPPIDARLSAHI